MGIISYGWGPQIQPVDPSHTPVTYIDVYQRAPTVFTALSVMADTPVLLGTASNTSGSLCVYTGQRAEVNDPADTPLIVLSQDYRIRLGLEIFYIQRLVEGAWTDVGSVRSNMLPGDVRRVGAVYVSWDFSEEGYIRIASRGTATFSADMSGQSYVGQYVGQGDDYSVLSYYMLSDDPDEVWAGKKVVSYSLQQPPASISGWDGDPSTYTDRYAGEGVTAMVPDAEATHTLVPYSGIAGVEVLAMSMSVLAKSYEGDALALTSQLSGVDGSSEVNSVSPGTDPAYVRTDWQPAGEGPYTLKFGTALGGRG